MGGGETDRASRPAGTRTRGAADFDRRTFIRRAGQTGMAAGALMWSAPRIHSVSSLAAAGSPPPASTTTPTVSGGPLTPPAPSGPGSSELVVQGVHLDPSRGDNLAITGAELGNIAVLGGASVGMGELIRRKGMQRKRVLEAEEERYADPPPAGDSPDPA
jgi:hypothetical protein